MKIATVCSGIGSPEQALKELEIPHEITFACEIDKYARQTYLANFEPKMMLTDMTKEDWIGEQFYADLIVGGIPCQSFSLAGKRLGELDPRGLLFFDFYRYVKNQRPKYFIIENVKGLLSDQAGKTFENWCQLLGQSMNTHLNMFNHPESLMYNLHFKVLNSKDFGVPQNRERVFLIGIRNDLPNSFRFPKGERLTKRLKDILEPVVDEKYYLSDKMVEGLIDGKYINQDTQASQVHDIFNIAPTISAGTHGYALGYIQEPLLYKEKRTENANSHRDKDVFFEPSDYSNTVTTVQKDNLILVGNIYKSKGQNGNIYDENGISPTLSSGCTNTKGNGGIGSSNSPKIQVTEATKKGYAEATEGDSINLSNPESKTRRGRVGKGVANTLDTACNQAVVVPEFITLGVDEFGFKHGIYDLSKVGEDKIKQTHRIRRLTPLETMRLQGYPDDFKQPVSDTQRYKQAGNSITVNVMKAIIKNLLPILNSNITD